MVMETNKCPFASKALFKRVRYTVGLLPILGALLVTLLLFLAIPPIGQAPLEAKGLAPQTFIHSLQVTSTATITPTATIGATPTSTVTLTPTATITPTSTPFPQIRVTTIEPRRISTETGGTLSVFGSGFTSGTVIRVVGIGIIPTTYINGEAITGDLVPGLPTGQYDVQVGLGNLDGPNVVVEDALTIFGPTPTPVPTVTPTPTPTAAYVFGQPQLAIESASTDPALLPPGETFELTFAAANLGNWTAVDVAFELQSTDIAVPSAGSNVRILPRIGVEETITVTMSLVLRAEAPEGPQNLTFNVNYFDLSGQPYNTVQSVGLTIADVTPTPTPGPDQPRLVLTTYNVEPEGALQPGSIFDLIITLTNVGVVDADNVIVTLGGSGGEQLQPFALVNAGNVRFVDTIAAGDTVEIRQAMLVAGTADAGVYNLPIALGSAELPEPETQVINLLVERPPLLQVDYYRGVDGGLVGQPLELPVEVVNISRSLINVSTLSVNSPQMEMSNNSIYVGPLDGGTSGSLDAVGIPQEAGTLDVVVAVDYLDDFNQAQTFERTLTVEVEGLEEEPPPEEDAPPGEEPLEQGFLDLLWRFIRGLLGLGS